MHEIIVFCISFFVQFDPSFSTMFFHGIGFILPTFVQMRPVRNKEFCYDSDNKLQFYYQYEVNCLINLNL